MVLPFLAAAAPAIAQGATSMMGSQMIPGIMGAAMTGMAGSQRPEAIQYSPTYAQPYQYDPYAFQGAEKGLYDQLMGEILDRSRIQESESTAGMSERLNRMGLGASSMYSTGRARIGQQAQTQRAGEMSEARRKAQELHEARAEAQRQRQHEWSLGPGVAGQRETIGARAGHQQDVNQMGAQLAQPFSKAIGGMITGGGGGAGQAVGSAARTMQKYGPAY